MISLTVQARFLMSNGTKMYQVSHNDAQYNLTMGDECNPDTFASTYNKTKVACLFGKYEENPLLLYFQIFHLFGWLWGSQFLVAFAECSLAGAFASYYWTRDKSKVVFQMFLLFMSLIFRRVSCKKCYCHCMKCVRVADFNYLSTCSTKTSSSEWIIFVIFQGQWS